MIQRALKIIKGWFYTQPEPVTNPDPLGIRVEFNNLFGQLLANGVFKKDLSFASSKRLFVQVEKEIYIYDFPMVGQRPRYIVSEDGAKVRESSTVTECTYEHWVELRSALMELLSHLGEPKSADTPGLTKERADRCWDSLVDEFLASWNTTAPISEEAFLETANEALSPMYVGKKLSEYQEFVAEKIYNNWSDNWEFTPWVPGGNSFKQDDARREARKLSVVYLCLHVKKDLKDLHHAMSR